ncbi:MAG TPA: flippase, partial [Thermoplasmatales archaeon]|nr:flippase [Thermoplasmatales archaeon]
MIARKSALIIFTQIINALLGYTALKFIALYMQPWEYGVIGFAYGFVALFSVFGNLGFNAAHVKRVSEGKDLGKCVGT